jgi:hypothetical protein
VPAVSAVPAAPAAPACGDGVLNGGESAVDCGGSCGACPGQACGADAGCASGVCQDGRCCGGNLEDCTRCARRLAVGIDCSSDGLDATNDCDSFLQCLSDNAGACSQRSALGCSGDEPEGPCNHLSYGGNDGPGIVLADAILREAQCSL